MITSTKIVKLDPPYKKKIRIWVCSYCKSEFVWNEDSRWFGKLENEKLEQEILKLACSEKCFNKLKSDKNV